MRLILLALLVIAPTALAASEALTLEFASEGVLGSDVFNLAFIAPITATRSGITEPISWGVSSGVVQARYIVDGVTSFIPVVVSGAGQGVDTSEGALLLDVTGTGAGQGFRTSVRLAGADGTFVGSGTIGHGASIGTLAALVEIE